MLQAAWHATVKPPLSSRPLHRESMGRPSNRDLATRSPGIAATRTDSLGRERSRRVDRNLDQLLRVDPNGILDLRYSTATRYSKLLELRAESERIESMNDRARCAHTQTICVTWMGRLLQDHPV